MAYDANVVRVAYSTARRLGASDKVMLALFEAAIVESGFRNLDYGHDDSLGFLQQRPSQGWPNPMDVPTATTSFVTRAQAVETRYATAGQLAQAIQRSAFPFKYDAVRGQAQTLLNQTSVGQTSDVDVDTLPLTGGTVSNVDTLLKTLTSKGFWVRYGTMLVGILLVGIALIQITGAASAVSKVVSVVPGGKVVKQVAKAVK